MSDENQDGNEPEKRDTIWAPWRIDYILSREEYTEGCFLCTAFEADPSDWKEHKLLHKTDRYGVILNKFPYNTAHALISPTRHVPDLSDLDAEEKLNLMEAADTYCSIVRDEMEPDGFNIGINLGEAAGAGVPEHLHVHVVPRWEGDSNFMPVTANTQVMPQSLDELYDLLKESY